MTNERYEMLRGRYRGCVLGSACGDAIGKSVETMTPEAILDATEGRGITGFHPSCQQTFATARLAPYQWTDDTQLGCAGARSLIRMRGFDLEDQAREHIVEYHRRTNRGWVKSTEIGIGELIAGTRKPGDAVRDLQATGMGNGIAMQVWSLALATAPITTIRTPLDIFRTFVAQVEQLASLTHRDPCAATGAQIIGFLMYAALGMDAPKRIHPVLPMTAMDLCTKCPNHPTVFIDRLRTIPGTRNVAEVAARTGTRSTVYESVPFVIGVLHHHWRDLRSAVLAAVNAGGDTDSNGAMVGAILGAMHGVLAIPEEWRTSVEDADELVRLADGLLDLAFDRS